MIWYQYVFLAIAVVCYSIKDLQTFGKLKWMFRKKDTSFWGFQSWKRKYKSDLKTPAFFGSTTFLVFLTDGFHLMQFCFKILLAIGIFGFTWSALIAWSVWTGLQWGCFKLFSR